MIKNAKNNILISFSGGETSAYMIHYLLTNFPNKNYKFVFANTGEETEETLLFTKQCQDYFNIDLVWLEYEDLSFRIVDYNSAYRSHNLIEIGNKWQNHPFRKYIEKFMIPNKQNLTCTRELKEYPIRRYLSSIGWKPKDYDIAIGIRADEINRISKHYYPLIRANITKPMINNFWDKMPFRLQLKGYEGNCKVCWKKSFRKLATIALENPFAFAFFEQMENEYGGYIRKEQAHRLTPPMRFFRENKTVDDIFKMAKTGFKKATDDSTICEFQMELDFTNGCVDSCEVFQ